MNTKTHVVPVVVDSIGLVSTKLKKHVKRVGVMSDFGQTYKYTESSFAWDCKVSYEKY